MALGVAATTSEMAARRFPVLPALALLAGAAMLAACSHAAPTSASAGKDVPPVADSAADGAAADGAALDGLAPAAGSPASIPAAAVVPDPSPPGPPGSGIAGGAPYVVIRFPDSSVDYQSALAEAVRRAKARKPNLAFDLVALTPRAKSADELADDTQEAEERAAAVAEALAGMGIPADHVHIVTWTGQPIEFDEIRLYIR